jgi:DNA-binding NtrC family response regulator
MRVLIVEDSPQLANRLASAFEKGGHHIQQVSTLHEARETIATFWPEFVLLDANFPTNSDTRAEFNAAALLDILAHPDRVAPTVILMSGDDRTALHFHKIEAWLNTGRIADVIPKNVEGGWDFLKELLVHRVEILRPQRFHPESDDTARNQEWLYRNGIVALEETMLKIASRIRRIVNRTGNDTSLLITGPSGAGKGLIAYAIHAEMQRKTQQNLPFVAFHCGTFVETTVCAEILGYVKGTFTGAESDKAGCLESAAKGVLLLDDIHLLPKEAYGVLLSALQERTFRRLGSTKATGFDARVISTTNVDLSELDRHGQMPEEFYNRIARDTIVIPPLVQRPLDIEPLMRHFMTKRRRLDASIPRDFSIDVIRAFQSYSWPGDVRQLDNIIGDICTHSSENVLSLASLLDLDLKHKGQQIKWNAMPEIQQERDLLLFRLGWQTGWRKLTEREFEMVGNWLKDLWPLRRSLLDDLSKQVQSRPSPKAIHFMKAILFLTLVENNRARHAELQAVLELGWDYTNRVLCFLAGIQCDGLAGFDPPLLIRSSDGGKWVYALRESLLGAKPSSNEMARTEGVPRR